MDVIQRIFNAGTGEQCVLVGPFCWSLWQRRNKWAWEQINTFVFDIKAMPFNMSADWKRAKEASVKNSRVNSTIGLWIKPLTGLIKINVVRHGTNEQLLWGLCYMG